MNGVEKVIDSKANAIAVLWQISPLLCILFVILFFSTLITLVIIILIKNPAIIDKLPFLKKRNKRIDVSKNKNKAENNCTDFRQQHEKQLNELYEYIKNDTAERNERRNITDDRFKKIEKLLEILTDNHKENEKLTIMGILYNDHVEIDIKLDLFIYYLFKNHNGNMKEYMLAEIMRNNARKLWNNAKDRFRTKNGISHEGYFVDSIKWIDARLA